ncbi:transcription factor, putative [Ricinus communis]|uniref:Transcription factor, putative n=2 Tax=Ricinus communis TaxID=3988 RepID=B9SQM6_RICCO|nr:transcription factor, putative [Ricinus communis]
MPSPKSLSVSSVDMATLSPLALGSSSLALPSVSTPPMSPLATASSSPKSGGLWQNKINLTPPALQLPGSRLKTALCARDLELERELLALDNHSNQLQQQQFMDEMSGLSSPSCWSKDFNRVGDLKPTNLDDVFGSLDPSLLAPLQGLSFKSSTPTQLQSPTGLEIRQNMNQFRSSYPTNLSSSPVRKPAAYGFDSSAAVAAAMMNSRSSAFAKRSHSFIDRGAATNRLGITAAANSVSMMSANLSDWSSPDGKLDWGVQGDELNKLKKSASFGFRSSNNPTMRTNFALPNVDEPDVSWVNTLVKDVPPVGSSLFGAERQYSIGKGVRESLPPWMEQMYIEQEQMVA